MHVIDPRGISAVLWTAQTGLGLMAFGTIPKLTDEREWRNWAAYVAQLPALAAVGVPWHKRFRTWQEWAVQFNQAAQGL